MTEYDLDLAHNKSIFHRDEIKKSEVCGCFHCLTIFSPDEINEWTDDADPRGSTALCPKCAIDSILGSASGFPINEGFLKAMQNRWFSYNEY